MPPINDIMATSNMSPRNSDRSPRYPDPRALPTGPVQGETRSSLMGIPLKHLTKMERKRIEWERQKAEDEELQRQVRHLPKSTTHMMPFMSTFDLARVVSL